MNLRSLRRMEPPFSTKPTWKPSTIAYDRAVKLHFAHRPSGTPRYVCKRRFLLAVCILPVT